MEYEVEDPQVVNRRDFDEIETALGERIEPTRARGE
jgi:hypothetical protein